MPTGSTHQHRQQKDITIRRTIEHTLDVIGEHGIEGVTTKRISDRMNMSTGILHHHFGTKDNIIYQAYVFFVEAIRVQTRNILQSRAHPRTKLIALGRILYDDLHSSPAGVNLWLNFWHRSCEDTRVKRLLTIYHKRLISNMTCTLYQLHQDRNWARHSAKRYFAVLQGNWVALVLTGTHDDREQSIRLLEQELDTLISIQPRGIPNEHAR